MDFRSLEKMRLEFWVKCSHELLSEVNLAQWAILLTSTPNEDALTVEIVADVAWQRDYRLARLELLDAKRALTV